MFTVGLKTNTHTHTHTHTHNHTHTHAHLPSPYLVFRPPHALLHCFDSVPSHSNKIGWQGVGGAGWSLGSLPLQLCPLANFRLLIAHFTSLVLFKSFSCSLQQTTFSISLYPALFVFLTISFLPILFISPFLSAKYFLSPSSPPPLPRLQATAGLSSLSCLPPSRETSCVFPGFRVFS